MKLHGQLVERIPTGGLGTYCSRLSGILAGFNSHEKASPEMRAAMKRLMDEHKPTAHTRGVCQSRTTPPGSYAQVIAERHVKQIGTLGGGNHFIELLHDEGDDIWLMLHSGSRNIGNITAQYYDG